MPEKLFFVHEDGAMLAELAVPYTDRGWAVDMGSPTEDTTFEQIMSTGPVAAIFCLDGSCAQQTRTLAERVAAHGTHPLMVFVGGTEDSISEAKQAVPIGIFVRADELSWVLKHLAYKV